MPTIGGRGDGDRHIEDNIILREKRALQNRKRIGAACAEKEIKKKQDGQQVVNNYFTEMLLRIQESFPKEVECSWALGRSEGSRHQADEDKGACSKQGSGRERDWAQQEGCGKAGGPHPERRRPPLPIRPAPVPPRDACIHPFVFISVWIYVFWTCTFLFPSMKIVPDFGNRTFSFFWKTRNTHTHTHAHAHSFLYLFIYYKQWIFLRIPIPGQPPSIYPSCHLFTFAVPAETSPASWSSIRSHICSIPGHGVLPELSIPLWKSSLPSMA